MKTRELTKNITIDDELYIIRKMNVFSSAQFALLVSQKILPALPAVLKVFEAIEERGTKSKRKKADDAVDFTEALNLFMPVLGSLNPDDVKIIITDCLSCCEKVKPAGATRIITNDFWNVPELEHDLVTCIKLCYEMIRFNVAGFFPEGGLNFSPIIQKAMHLSSMQT